MELVPARLVSAEQDVLEAEDVPQQLRPPPVFLLRERQGLSSRVARFEPRLSAESRLLRAGKSWLELWPFRMEQSRRVWIALRPGLRAYPPSASDFPAAAE
jgi:hypothetical protein